MNHMNRRTWTALCALGAALAVAVGLNLRPAMAADADGKPGMQHVEAYSEYIGLYRDALALVSDFDQIASSRSASAMSALMNVEDHFGKDKVKTIAFLERLLPKVDDRAVQRAIRIKLADLYKDSGQSDKAINQLEHLILDDPGA